MIREVGHYVEVSWKVVLTNRCRDSLTAHVKFLLLDARDFELDSGIGRTVVTFGDGGVAQGTMLVSKGVYQRVTHGKGVATW